MNAVLEQVFSWLVDPVVVIDRAGIVQFANPAACEMFGWPHDELVGGKVNRLMGEPYRSEHDGYLARFLETGERRAIGQIRQVIGRRRDGREFPCELSVSCAEDGGGMVFYGIVRDVSQREEMAARLTQVERLAAMGELAAGIAHEINNPVNTIINCAQLLRDGEEDPSLLDDIVQEGMRIAMIVRDLLDFARDRRDDFEPTDVAEVVQRALRLVSRRLERQGITLRSALEGDLPPIDGLSHRIQQVILNLVLNARDALVDRPEPREIEVRATRTEREGRSGVSVTVRDNGPGIDRATRDRIFEPFFTTKRTTAGTGLGLAVSRGIVQDHGGTLEVRSEPGAYAEFEMFLPAREG